MTITANSRRPASWEGGARQQQTGEVEKSISPNDDYWLGFCDGVLSTREDSLSEGYMLGRADGSREALDEWVSATFAPTYTPRTAFVPSADPPSPLRVSDRKALTSAQIRAGAAWSWRQVEARIAERGRATA